MRKILIIAGKQGSGKTSNSNLVIQTVQNLGYVVKTFKFAATIYELHDACLPILKRRRIRANLIKKDRALLEVLGTEYGRMRLYENVWVEQTRNEIKEWLAGDELGKRIAFIDDCRFPNEFDEFTDAYRVRLTAPIEIRRSRVPPEEWSGDNDPLPASEWALDEYEQLGKFDLVVSTEHARLDVTAHSIRTSWFKDDMPWKR